MAAAVANSTLTTQIRGEERLSRPSLKARKTSSNSFVVTSRLVTKPVPASASGRLTGWTSIDVEMPDAIENANRSPRGRPASDLSARPAMLRTQSAAPLTQPSTAAGKRPASPVSSPLSPLSPQYSQFGSAEDEEQHVKDTNKIAIAYDSKGRRMVNQ